MSNQNLRISNLAVEPLFVSFRAENPAVGPFDFSSATALLALVRGTPTLPDWFSATIEAQTIIGAEGEQYFVANGTIDGSLYDLGEYQIYIRVEDGTYTFVQRAGTVQVY